MFAAVAVACVYTGGGEQEREARRRRAEEVLSRHKKPDALPPPPPPAPPAAKEVAFGTVNPVATAAEFSSVLTKFADVVVGRLPACVCRSP